MRGMTTEAASEPAVDAEALPPANPYTVTLLWLWIGALVVAGILALMGVDAADKSYELGAGAAQFAWATLFGSVGIGSLLMWLLLSGLRWQAPEN